MPEAIFLKPGILLVVGLLMLSTGATAAEAIAPERIVWQRIPIEIELAIDEERLLHFPGPVRIGLPAELEPALRVQSLDGTLYLLARDAFGPTRVMVREIENGKTYLLDLSAAEGNGPHPSVQIVSLEETQSEEDEEGETLTGPFPDYSYVTLTRFAAMELYAPARLLSPLPGVVRVAVRSEEVPLVRGGAVEAIPVVAWRAGSLYVTGVKLVNRTSLAVTLDPRTLRGSWLAATFQHNRLLPAGDEADRTALYLISARPFEASL